VAGAGGAAHVPGDRRQQPERPGGAPLGTIFIFQDLTEIHALEQEVRLKERMAALGGMAAGMAHELRNPLAAISGAVQYLKGNLRPDGETLELMDIILRESHRLDAAIRDFLTFARPAASPPGRATWCGSSRTA
jgi:signal transduction histidine kinase